MDISDPVSTIKVHLWSDKSNFKYIKFDMDAFIVYAVHTVILKNYVEVVLGQLPDL